MTTTTCDECGAEYGLAHWPFCHGDPAAHTPVGPHFHEGFEPYWDEHLTTDPVFINSRSERKQLMKENNLDYRKKAKAPNATLYFDQKGR